jgi:hypothetical protein
MSTRAWLAAALLAASAGCADTFTSSPDRFRLLDEERDKPYLPISPRPIGNSADLFLAEAAH